MNNGTRSLEQDENNDIALKTLHQRTIDEERPQSIGKIEKTISEERQSYAEGLTIHGTTYKE